MLLAGVRDILIISTPRDTPQFEALFGDGRHRGISLRYAVRPSAHGLAQAFPKWIDDAPFQALAAPLAKNGSGEHLLSLLENQVP